MPKSLCIVKGCPSLNKLFTLPMNKVRRDTWLEIVQREDLREKEYKTLKGYGICAAHFPPIAFLNSSREKLCRNAFPTGNCEESKQTEVTRPSTPPYLRTLDYFDTSPEMCNDRVLQHTRRTYSKVNAELKCVEKTTSLEVPGTSQQSDNHLEVVHTWALNEGDIYEVIKKEDWTNDVTDRVDEQSVRIIRKVYLHEWIDNLDNEAFDRFLNNIQGAMKEEDQRKNQVTITNSKLDEVAEFFSIKKS